MEFGWLKDPELSALNERKLSMLRAGSEILDLGMINPDIPPPRLLVDKLLELTVRPSNHRYAVARGVRRLREAFAHKYADRFNVKIDPETEVCVTLGSKDGLEQVLRVLAPNPQSSDRKPAVLAFGPVYPHYRIAARLNGYEFRVAPLTPSFEEFFVACMNLPPKSIVLLNFPHNPTGTVAPSSFFEKLVPIVHERDLYLVNDFVYGELTYSGQPAISILSLNSIRDRAIEFYSLSKCYSVPGWRVGAVLGSAPIVHAVSALKSHIDYGIFLPIQGAAAAALHAPASLVEPIVAEYARRADIICGALKAIGWEVCVPVAGAAVWARCPAWKAGSHELALLLLEKALVGCTPGAGFFEHVAGESSRNLRDDNWIRFALVAPSGSLRMAIDRVGAAVAEHVAAYSENHGSENHGSESRSGNER